MRDRAGPYPVRRGGAAREACGTKGAPEGDATNPSRRSTPWRAATNGDAEGHERDKAVLLGKAFFGSTDRAERLRRTLAHPRAARRPDRSPPDRGRRARLSG